MNAQKLNFVQELIQIWMKRVSQFHLLYHVHVRNSTESNVSRSSHDMNHTHIRIMFEAKRSQVPAIFESKQNRTNRNENKCQMVDTVAKLNWFHMNSPEAKKAWECVHR